jgi:hypothetical protein
MFTVAVKRQGNWGITMSEEGSFWGGLAEKLIGLVLILLGIILFYFTLTSGPALTIATGIFGFLCFLMLISGVFLLITKPPE